MVQYKLLQIKEKPGGNVVKTCKVDQTTFTASFFLNKDIFCIYVPPATFASTVICL